MESILINIVFIHSAILNVNLESSLIKYKNNYTYKDNIKKWINEWVYEEKRV